MGQARQSGWAFQPGWVPQRRPVRQHRPRPGWPWTCDCGWPWAWRVRQPYQRRAHQPPRHRLPPASCDVGWSCGKRACAGRAWCRLRPSRGYRPRSVLRHHPRATRTIRWKNGHGPYPKRPPCRPLSRGHPGCHAPWALPHRQDAKRRKCPCRPVWAQPSGRDGLHAPRGNPPRRPRRQARMRPRLPGRPGRFPDLPGRGVQVARRHPPDRQPRPLPRLPSQRRRRPYPRQRPARC